MEDLFIFCFSLELFEQSALYRLKKSVLDSLYFMDLPSLALFPFCLAVQGTDVYSRCAVSMSAYGQPFHLANQGAWAFLFKDIKNKNECIVHFASVCLYIHKLHIDCQLTVCKCKVLQNI